MTPLTKITRPDKLRAIIEVDVSQEEHLLPTQIGYYDRVLGLKSPWFSLDLDETDNNGSAGR